MPETKPRIILTHQQHALEVEMVGQARWAEIRRLHEEEGQSISAIARCMELDRMTVRRCLRARAWRPYQRRPGVDKLLTGHADWLHQRAPQVRYSARILYQELIRERGYTGSYETVKRFVSPLRELVQVESLTQTRFETAPGEQSQVDWGQARIPLRHGPTRLHLFVLTLGFSRRGFYWAYPDERLMQFLEAHERAFAHFGGLTGEHLYDRPRTVCYANARRRYEKGPVILTSNQSFGSWGEVFGDRVIATAILDRVLHHAITINIRGNSYRLKDKLKAGLIRTVEPTVN